MNLGVLLQLDNLLQLGILVTGCTAVLLLGVPDSWGRWRKWKRWAPVFGLLSQPLWFIFAGKTQAWGLFLLNIAYSVSWLNGVWLNWGPRWLAARDSRRIAPLKRVSL